MKMFRNLPWLLSVCLGVTILNSCAKVETGLSLSGATSTLAGTAGSSGSTDGTGTAARFYGPYGITTDGTYLYVADSGNNTIRLSSTIPPGPARLQAILSEPRMDGCQEV